MVAKRVPASKSASQDASESEDSINHQDNDDMNEVLALASLSHSTLKPSSSSSDKVLCENTVNYQAKIKDLHAQVDTLTAQLTSKDCKIKEIQLDFEQRTNIAHESKVKLEASIMALQSEIVDLQKSLTLMKDTNRVLTDSLMVSQQQSKISKEDWISPEDAEKLIQARLNIEKLTLVSIYEAAEAEYKFQIQKVQDFSKKLEFQRDSQREKAKELEKKSLLLETSLQGLREAGQEFAKERQSLKRQLVQAKVDLSKALDETKILQEALAKAKTDLDKNRDRFTSERATLEGNLAAKIKATEEFNSRLTEVLVDLENLKTKSRGLESENNLLKNSTEYLLQRIKQLEAEIQRLQNRGAMPDFSDEEILRKEIQNAKDALEETTEIHNQEVKIWKSKVLELEDTVSKLTQERNKLLENDLPSDVTSSISGSPSTKFHRAQDHIRTLKHQLLQVNQFAVDAESKMERLLSAACHSRGSSSTSTLHEFAMTPSDIENDIAVAYITAGHPPNKAEKIIAEEKLANLLKVYYEKSCTSEPSSPREAA